MGPRCWGIKIDEFVGLPATLGPLDLLSSAAMSRSLSRPSIVGGGSRTGEGARDGFVECILSVLRGPRNGDVEGV